MNQLRTQQKKKEFLENHISCGRYVSRTCRKIGISRSTFYEWRKRDWSFGIAVSQLEERRAYKKEMLAEAWAKMMGSSVTSVCEIVGISRWTYYHWCHNDPYFQYLKDNEYQKERYRRFGEKGI